MPIPAIIGTVIAAAPTLSGAFAGLTANKDDPARFATAEGWYAKAIQGDTGALCALKHMSGKFGVGSCGTYGAPSGFATQIAKEYCYVLYVQAQNIVNGSIPPGTPLPTRPNAAQGVNNTIGQVAQGVSTVTGDIASQYGYPSKQEQQRNIAIVVGVVVVVGVVATAIYLARR